MSRDKVIEIARGELGTLEDPIRTNKTKYGEWYEFNGVPWCAIFVSWVFDRAGVNLGQIESKNGYHLCQGAHNFFRREGRLTSNPQKGDIVMFDWDSDGNADHTGIFVEWVNSAKTKFLCLEGNTSMSDDSNGGTVMERTRRIETVKSFASPSVYGDFNNDVPDNVLRVGDRGSNVVQVQTMLNDLGYETLADGWYGNKTAASVKAFQKKNLMPQTGEVDEVTLGALQEEVKRKIAKSKLVSGTYLRYGDSGFFVVELQKALNEKMSRTKLHVDGQFGRNTTRELKKFQTKNGLDVDGIAGPQTFKALGMI